MAVCENGAMAEAISPAFTLLFLNSAAKWLVVCIQIGISVGLIALLSRAIAKGWAARFLSSQSLAKYNLPRSPLLTPPEQFPWVWDFIAFVILTSLLGTACALLWDLWDSTAAVTKWGPMILSLGLGILVIISIGVSIRRIPQPLLQQLDLIPALVTAKSDATQRFAVNYLLVGIYQKLGHHAFLWPNQRRMLKLALDKSQHCLHLFPLLEDYVPGLPVPKTGGPHSFDLWVLIVSTHLTLIEQADPTHADRSLLESALPLYYQMIFTAKGRINLIQHLHRLRQKHLQIAQLS